nr:hypothetical protein LOCMHKOF_00099 [Providencia stuartii]
MIRSLAAHIPCSKSVLVALMFSVAGGAYAQESPLTEQDKALIEQGKQIAQKAQKMEMPSLLQNQHMDEAQAEAKAFFKQLQTTNPTLKEMHRKQAEKGIYSDHRILVFASLSLGEQGLDDVLTAVSGQPDSVIVFRGIPEGMNLGQGVKAIQALAAKKDPVPNIIINPTLFKTYNITAVPTIVMLEDEPLPGEQPNVVAQVSGLSDPVWLAREVDNGEKGDLGVKGPVEKISEPDLIDVAKKRLANIDWEEKKKQAIERFWTKQNFNELPRAPKSRTREIDPSVMITSDISTPDGTVFAHAGDVINPLCDPKEVCKPGTRPFTQAVVVFDPLDKKQMELLAKKLPEIKLEPGVQRITYIATEFDKDKGWDSYKSVTDNFDAPVYLLTPDLITRFELEHTPSVITARGKKFVVRELAEEGGEWFLPRLSNQLKTSAQVRLSLLRYWLVGTTKAGFLHHPLCHLLLIGDWWIWRWHGSFRTTFIIAWICTRLSFWMSPNKLCNQTSSSRRGVGLSATLLKITHHGLSSRLQRAFRTPLSHRDGRLWPK